MVGIIIRMITNNDNNGYANKDDDKNDDGRELGWELSLSGTGDNDEDADPYTDNVMMEKRTMRMQMVMRILTTMRWKQIT